jgi:hypothetical protein
MDIKGAQALKLRLETTAPAEANNNSPSGEAPASSALPIYRWVLAVPPHGAGPKPDLQDLR